MFSKREWQRRNLSGAIDLAFKLVAFLHTQGSDQTAQNQNQRQILCF